MSIINFIKRHKTGFIIAGSVIASVVFWGLIIAALSAAGNNMPKNTNENTQVTTQPETTTKQITEEFEMPFEVTYEDTNTLNKGVEQTKQEGVNGTKTITYEITMSSSGEEMMRKTIKEEITVKPINKIILVGTYVAPAAPAVNTYSKPSPTTTTPAAYYTNCAEAENAGVAPIYQGQPGYRSGLDRDHDGVACDQ